MNAHKERKKMRVRKARKKQRHVKHVDTLGKKARQGRNVVAQ